MDTDSETNSQEINVSGMSGSDADALEFEDDYEDVESDEDVDNDVDLDEALIPALSKNKSSQIKPIDVLVDIDQNRKKVITLHNGSDGLEQEFLNVVARDVALKEYANSTVIFQIFSEKFNTWVDLDKSKELTDGTHLKAVFLAKSERTKESSHYKNKVKKRKRSYSSDNSKEERERRRKFRKRRSTSNEDDWKSEKSRRSRSSDESKRRVTPNLITSTATVCDNSNTCFRPSGNKHTENDGNFSQINDVGLCKLEFEANATLVNKSSSRNVDQQDLQPASEGNCERSNIHSRNSFKTEAISENCSCRTLPEEIGSVSIAYIILELQGIFYMV
ncbi:uncharacterized protein [Periplaneta americana]|uniref:uncharacterized protein isoform X2 n=1 Tax=Periplaneta americana TaxID=6978 RepID=UPI0037E70DAA